MDIKRYKIWHTQNFIINAHKYQPFCHQTLYVKKEIYQKEGGFDTSFEVAADYEFFLRMLRSSRSYHGYYINIIGCYFSVSGASSNFFKARLEDIKCRLKNGYSYTFSIYIFIKLAFLYILQKLPLIKRIKQIIRKEKIFKK